MYTRILVPLDGSPTADRAVPIAARLARASGSTVLLLRVVAPPLPQALFLPRTEREISDVDPKQIPREVEEYVARVAARPELAGVSVKPLLLTGRPAPTIVQISREQAADLVLISTHGQGDLSRWKLGGVAQHLARQSPIPVLILPVPDPHKEGSAAESVLSKPALAPRVLVTLDGSQVAEAALGPAADLSVALALPAPGALHLLVVIEREFGDVLMHTDDARTAMLVEGARRYLVRVAKHLEQTHGGSLQLSSSVATAVVSSSDDVAATILRVAERGEDAQGSSSREYDVIAMASHGFTGITRWLVGSVTERVLQAAKFPMLIVRPEHITAEASPLTTGEY